VTSPARQQNAFDALRLLLAGTVVYSHSWLLGGFGEEPFYAWDKHQAIAGEIGVLGFFGLSGFLVGASWQRARSVGDFFTRRARRILPGYWACLLVTAFALAPAIYFFRRGGLAGYPWFDAGGATYVLCNVGLYVRQWTIAGVLAGAPYDGSLNGSLWSLFPEFCCYVGLAAVGLAGLTRQRRYLLVVLTALLLFLNAVHAVSADIGTPALPAPVVLAVLTPYPIAFAVGLCAQAWERELAPGWPAATVLLLVTVLLLRWGGFRAAAPLIVPLLVIHAGLAVALPLRADWSYGLYIYAFPVQQLLACFAPLRTSWPLFFGVSLAVALAFAAASWHLVESRFLRRVAPPDRATAP